MWPFTATLLALAMATAAELIPPTIDITTSPGVKSMGFKVVYGDEDMTVINEVVNEIEKKDPLKTKAEQNSNTIRPLPPQDVKCLMSVDRYCSKEMGKMKSVLIQALKDDCSNCTLKEKEDAGKIVASMMAHDPVAWKLFLTRYDGLKRLERILGSALQSLPPKKPSKLHRKKFKVVGEPVNIENSKNRYAMPGVTIRVKRFNLERMT